MNLINLLQVIRLYEYATNVSWSPEQWVTSRSLIVAERTDRPPALPLLPLDELILEEDEDDADAEEEAEKCDDVTEVRERW